MANEFKRPRDEVVVIHAPVQISPTNKGSKVGGVLAKGRRTILQDSFTFLPAPHKHTHQDSFTFLLEEEYFDENKDNDTRRSTEYGLDLGLDMPVVDENKEDPDGTEVADDGTEKHAQKHAHLSQHDIDLSDIPSLSAFATDTSSRHPTICTHNLQDSESGPGALRRLASGSSAYSPRTLHPQMSGAQSMEESPSVLHDTINDLTQRSVSQDMIQLIASFWSRHVASQDITQRKKLVALITAAMPQPMALDVSESVDMLGWMLRQLQTDVDSAAARSALYELGAFYESKHVMSSVQLTAFWAQMTLAMISALSDCFGPDLFSAEIEFALDEVCALAVQCLTSKDLKIPDALRTADLETADFTCDVRSCLASALGREYLFRFLLQRHCEAEVLCLKLCSLYRAMPNDGRLGVAAQISRLSLNPYSAFSVKLRSSCRQSVGGRVHALLQFSEEFTRCCSSLAWSESELSSARVAVADDLFEEVEEEIYSMLTLNYWSTFTSVVKTLVC